MALPIFYESTNRDLSLEQLLRIKDINPNIKGPFTDRVSFADAIIMGQAPDTGLFVPTKFSPITNEDLISLKGKPFANTAYLVFRKFFTEEEISNDDLTALVNDAYNFEYPLVHLKGRQWLLMHTESPTGDFKNTGARANARFLSHMREPGMNYIRVTSTSGDTGGAVGLADHNVPGLISVILYPKGHISEVQEDIIKKIGGNVIAKAVEDAMFSAIQDGMAKPALADQELRKELAKYKFGLTSGNSINWGRVMPQICHYVYAYAQLADPIGEPVIFSTGLGNMGHGLSGEMARMMGLPIFSVLPTNENDPFPRYMETGEYKPLTKEEQNTKCKSNSMIVRNPSNLARLFYFNGGQVDKDGTVNKYPDKSRISQHIDSPRVSMKQEDQTIVDVFKMTKERVMIEYHGACGVHGLWQYADKTNLPSDALCIVQETANPYKYKDDIRELLGVEPKKPKAYEWFDGRPSTGTTMPCSYAKLRELIINIAKNHKK